MATTVSELIEKLKKMPQEQNVVLLVDTPDLRQIAVTGDIHVEEGDSDEVWVGGNADQE